MERNAVAVVVPAYNEAATIAEVVARILRQLPWVIVVDDGSRDATVAQLAPLPVTLLRQPHNGGKAAALQRGIDHALAGGAAAVITLDGDGQHAPEEIPQLLTAAQHHPNALVIAARLHYLGRMPKLRRFANRTANFWISWAAGTPIVDSQSGFRLYPAALLRAVRVAHDHRHGFVFESELLIEAVRRGFPCVAVAVEAIYPTSARPSYYRPWRDTSRITLMVASKLLAWGLYPRGLWRCCAHWLAPERSYAIELFSKREQGS